MLILKNVRLLKGQLASITVENAFFKQVALQNAMLSSQVGDWSLAQFALESSSKQPEPKGSPLVVDAKGAVVVPAAIDVHVHSRDPGYTYKEDWSSLAKAAFKGGVVAVVDMPNTSPPTMLREQVVEKAQLAEASGLDFRLMLGVGPDNISEIGALLRDANLPLGGLKVYYGQSTGNLMFADLERLHHELPDPMRGVLVFHSEDQCRIDAQYERLSCELRHDTKPEIYRIHSRIRDSESAWLSTQVILNWAKKWRRPIHIAHVSTPQELELIESVRQAGGVITCEVAPHHLLLSSDDYPRLGGFLKVNPPVRSPEEVALLREYCGQGKIDCFATDHAPHTREEKLRPYEDCPSGMPALEYFWPLFLECLKVSGASRPQAVGMLSCIPAKLFGFPRLGRLEAGFQASFVWLAEEPHLVSDAEVISKCGWTPYHGKELAVKVKATWHNGRCVYMDKI